MFQVAPVAFTYETVPANETVNWMMNHELVHVTLDDNAAEERPVLALGVFGGKVPTTPEQPETILYNYLTTPRSLTPRWYHEGAAVFFETWMAGGRGRAQSAWDEMVFRSMVRDGSRFYDAARPRLGGNEGRLPARGQLVRLRRAVHDVPRVPVLAGEARRVARAEGRGRRPTTPRSSGRSSASRSRARGRSGSTSRRSSSRRTSPRSGPTRRRRTRTSRRRLSAASRGPSSTRTRGSSTPRSTTPGSSPTSERSRWTTGRWSGSPRSRARSGSSSPRSRGTPGRNALLHDRQRRPPRRAVARPAHRARRRSSSRRRGSASSSSTGPTGRSGA